MYQVHFFGWHDKNSIGNHQNKEQVFWCRGQPWPLPWQWMNEFLACDAPMCRCPKTEGRPMASAFEILRSIVLNGLASVLLCPPTLIEQPPARGCFEQAASDGPHISGSGQVFPWHRLRPELLGTIGEGYERPAAWMRLKHVLSAIGNRPTTIGVRMGSRASCLAIRQDVRPRGNACNATSTCPGMPLPATHTH